LRHLAWPGNGRPNEDDAQGRRRYPHYARHPGYRDAGRLRHPPNLRVTCGELAEARLRIVASFDWPTAGGRRDALKVAAALAKSAGAPYLLAHT